MASVIVIFHVNPMLWQEEFFQAGPLSQSGTFFSNLGDFWWWTKAAAAKT